MTKTFKPIKSMRPCLPISISHLIINKAFLSTWFLKIVSLRTSVCVFVSVCVCVCVSALRLLITSGVIWTPYNWLKQVLQLYMATVVVIANRCGLGIGTHRTH